MKQQILIINGGTTFSSYEEYISYLKNKEIKLERLKPSVDWKNTIQQDLGEKFEVFVPKMPNNTYARFEEWKIWIERVLDKLEDNLIIIGHSLGGVFLAKYLEENESPRKIKACILIAAPFDDKDSDEPLAEFNLSTSLDNFSKRAGKVYLVQSKDDPVVPITELEKYKKLLPNAEALILDGMGHFKIEFFPELIELIKRICI